MTQYGQSLLNLFRRAVTFVASELSSALTVRVPTGIPPSATEALAARFAGLLQMRSSELGRARLFAPATDVDPAADRITVLLADRPLAVIPPPSGREPLDDWIDAAVLATDTAVRRRLSVIVNAQGALAYMMDNGVSIARVDRALLDRLAPQVPDGASAELGELLIEELAPHEIVVEAAADTLRSVAGPRPGDLVRAREALFASTGLQFPDVRLVPVDEPPGTIRIRLNDVTLRRELGVSAGWREVVTVVAAALHEAAPWFVRTEKMNEALDQLRAALPDLIELSERCYPAPVLAACLREILRHGDSVRNLPRILWLLLEVDHDPGPGQVSVSGPRLLAGPTPTDPVPSDPVTLAATIRRHAADDLPVLGAPGGDDVVPLSTDIEDDLLGASDAASVAAAECRLLAEVPLSDRPLQVVIRSIHALRPVRFALQALPNPPRVVAIQELGLGGLLHGEVPVRVHI